MNIPDFLQVVPSGAAMCLSLETEDPRQQGQKEGPSTTPPCETEGHI